MSSTTLGCWPLGLVIGHTQWIIPSTSHLAEDDTGSGTVLAGIRLAVQRTNLFSTGC